MIHGKCGWKWKIDHKDKTLVGQEPDMDTNVVNIKYFSV